MEKKTPQNKHYYFAAKPLLAITASSHLQLDVIPFLQHCDSILEHSSLQIVFHYTRLLGSFRWTRNSKIL